MEENQMNPIEIINSLVGLEEWKTKKEINEELKVLGIEINERVFRKNIENHNKLFFEHLKSNYVAHSSKGYKLTTDTDEIKRSIEDNRKRGIDQLVKYSKCMKALGENINIKFSINDGEMFLVER